MKLFVGTMLKGCAFIRGDAKAVHDMLQGCRLSRRLDSFPFEGEIHSLDLLLHSSDIPNFFLSTFTFKKMFLFSALLCPCPYFSMFTYNCAKKCFFCCSFAKGRVQMKQTGT